MSAEAPAPCSALAHSFVPAINREPRRGGRRADLLLLHYTGMESAEKALFWLTCAQSKVSCHYLVDEAGVVTQMVPEGERAWHAGRSHWAGEEDINSCSIGIEIHNPGHGLDHRPFPEVQMRAVEALCRDIIGRNGIEAARVLAHSDVAPSRKNDPGELFDWARLARAGVGLWVEPEPIGDDAGLAPGISGPLVAALQLRLRAFGYGLAVTGDYDLATEQVVTAFQRHWRPLRVDGGADMSTVATLARLEAKLAVS
jgi:N-acetylmuramoyl-L-alanine amidase